MENKAENKELLNNESVMGDDSMKESRCVFREAINKYINLLNSQMDSFPIIINTLAANVQASASRFRGFLKANKIVGKEDQNEITYSVPIESGKEFERIQNELTHAVNAFTLIPKNAVVAMVSLYDAYLADLIECAYMIKPELLNACEKEFTFSEIIQYESIDKLKKHIVEKDVEAIIRESHIKQFDILSKKFKIELTKDLPSLDDFIEITERRNLFVHTNGKVSSQYLKMCKERPVDHKEEDVQIGDELYATPMYVEHCYKIMFEIGVKLGQVIWRKLENDLEKADDSLIDIGYELLKNNKYSLACVILDFACKPYVKHYNKICEFVLTVNRALAYYLQGNKTKCNEIIKEIDWSGSELKFQLAYNVLLEQYDDAIKIMKNIGKNDDLCVGYAEWPLFNDFRKTQQFKDTYKDIYGREYQYKESQPTRWEDIIQEAFDMIKVSKEQKSKKKSSQQDKEKSE